MFRRPDSNIEKTQSNLGRATDRKKGVVKYLNVFDHAGLLINEPPGTTGLLFI